MDCVTQNPCAIVGRFAKRAVSRYRRPPPHVKCRREDAVNRRSAVKGESAVLSLDPAATIHKGHCVSRAIQRIADMPNSCEGKIGQKQGLLHSFFGACAFGRIHLKAARAIRHAGNSTALAAFHLTVLLVINGRALKCCAARRQDRANSGSRPIGISDARDQRARWPPPGDFSYGEAVAGRVIILAPGTACSSARDDIGNYTDATIQRALRITRDFPKMRYSIRGEPTRSDDSTLRESDRGGATAGV